MAFVALAILDHRLPMGQITEPATEAIVMLHAKQHQLHVAAGNRWYFWLLTFFYLTLGMHNHYSIICKRNVSPQVSSIDKIQHNAMWYVQIFKPAYDTLLHHSAAGFSPLSPDTRGRISFSILNTTRQFMTWPSSNSRTHSSPDRFDVCRCFFSILPLEPNRYIVQGK